MLINIVYKHGRFAYAHNAPAQVNWGFKIYGGADGTRTRDPRRDRPVF